MASLKQTAGHKMAAFICLHDFEVLVFNKQDKKSNVNLLCVNFLVCLLLILTLLYIIGPVMFLWCGLIPFKYCRLSPHYLARCSSLYKNYSSRVNSMGACTMGLSVYLEMISLLK